MYQQELLHYTMGRALAPAHYTKRGCATGIPPSARSPGAPSPPKLTSGDVQVRQPAHGCCRPLLEGTAVRGLGGVVQQPGCAWSGGQPAFRATCRECPRLHPARTQSASSGISACKALNLSTRLLLRDLCITYPPRGTARAPACAPAWAARPAPWRTAPRAPSTCTGTVQRSA